MINLQHPSNVRLDAGRKHAARRYVSGLLIGVIGCCGLAWADTVTMPPLRDAVGQAPLVASKPTLSGVPTGEAAAGALTGTLSLARALQLAAHNHPLVSGAQARWQAANHALDGAEYGRLPSVAVDSALLGGGTRQQTLTLNQPVYTFNRITAAIDAAQSRLQSGKAGTDEAVQQIQEQVIGAYFEVLRARDRRLVAVDNVIAHEKLCATMERRQHAGVASTSDFLLARNRLDQARSDLAQTEAQRHKADSTLRSLINEPLTLLQNPQERTLAYATETTLVDASLAHSPTLVRLTAEAQAAGHDAESALGAAAPQIELRLQHVRSSQPVEYSDTRVYLAVEFQPGAGLSALSGYKASQSRRDAAVQDQMRARLEIEDRARQLWNDAVVATEQLALLGQLRSSNAEIVQSFVRQYEAGKRSWLDVLNAQRESSQTQLSFVDAYYASQSNIYRTEVLAGNAAALGGEAQAGELPTRASLSADLADVLPLERIRTLLGATAPGEAAPARPEPSGVLQDDASTATLPVQH